MVKRKPSRAYKSKTVKPAVSINEDDEDAEIRKENLLKRLDDFDLQVREVLLKMDADRQSTIDSIKHLYYVDKQRTAMEINNMLWASFLTQNTPCPRSEIRNSIAELVHKAEDQQLLTGKRNTSRRKIANTPVPPSSLSTRSRQPKNASGIKEIEEAPASRARRGKKNEIMSTPQHQGIATLPASLLITPKFDIRTPIPSASLRKPRYGEIAVSLKGSPLQVTKALQIDSLKEGDLDPETKEELKELHQKVTQLLNM